MKTSSVHRSRARSTRDTVRRSMKRPPAAFDRRTVDDLAIVDESALRHVALYADLKEVLRRDAYPFRVLRGASAGRADRALLLNLSFWAADAGGDVLAGESIEADVVAHAAWHHLAARAFAPRAGSASRTRAASARALSVDALFLGEAIASAFDVYLVGRLLGHAPRSIFLETQVPAMAETASAAGLSQRAFAALLADLARHPERAFEDLRELLCDATTALYACRDGEEATAALAALDGHRFSALLHRYELSNWVLYARAYGRRGGNDPRVRAVDAALRKAKAPLDWLAARWIAPALATSGQAALATSGQAALAPPRTGRRRRPSRRGTSPRASPARAASSPRTRRA
jgi:hypothetical protein